MFNRKYALFLIAVAAFLSSVLGAETESEEVSCEETILARYRALLCEDPPARADISQLMQTLSKDGTWPDIDYSDKKKASWELLKYLERLRGMSIASATLKLDDKQQELLLRSIVMALDHWNSKRYQAANWWYNRIGVPRLMRDIVIALGSGLPDPLITNMGNTVMTPAQWQKTRSPKLLALFRTHAYGRAPIGRPNDLRFDVVESNPHAMGGKATLKRIDIHFSGPGGEGAIQLALFVPNEAPKPVPGFLLICNRDRERIDWTRTKKSPFWPAERIVERGYIAATFHNSDLDPDNYDGFKDGVHGIFDSKNTRRASDAWGTIAAWAWGASRVMDYFETDKDVDEKRMGVLGHSRGGKTALWCGAEDERFALVISNNSGCTGAALARRRKGESIARINKVFPHWFCANYLKFNDKEDKLPIDQHALIALMAPRLVYVASAAEDEWADPEGEFLSCVHADPVYRLFGLQGVGTTEMPAAEHPLHADHIGYHLRTGEHDLHAYDWDCFMTFADKHWKKTQSNKENENENEKCATGSLSRGFGPDVRGAGCGAPPEHLFCRQHGPAAG